MCNRRMFDSLTNSLRSSVSGLIEDVRGYALTLTLVALPLLVGMAAYVIDASRVTNLHTDLQNAVDAMALAGARQLDGRDDAITRAQEAIMGMSGNRAWFSNQTPASGGMGDRPFRVTYSTAGGTASDVEVTFLGDIPASDNTLIGGTACADSTNRGTNDDCTLAGNIVEQSNNARYVRVRSNIQNVRTIFPIPGTGRDDVGVRAEAVATYTAAACDVTPIFICNPFESEGTDSFNTHFRSGDLYGRQFTMLLTGGSTVAPGNFGFLATNGNGANVLRDALATGSPGQCYSRDQTLTEPGANTGAADQGINVRFGLYAGPMNQSSNDYAFRPARNVRMGQDYGRNGNNPSCSRYEPEANTADAMPFPAGTPTTPIGGGTVSGSNWNISSYWQVSHGSSTAPTTAIGRPSLPPGASVPSTTPPSRYDVYKYEILDDSQPWLQHRAPGGERGTTQCYRGPADTSDQTDPLNDRRTIFAAVLNCNEQFSGGSSGGRREVEAAAYARMFLTKPMVTQGNDKYISLEVVDVTGGGGLGTVEDFLREEAELVR